MNQNTTLKEIIQPTVNCPECGLELDAGVPVCPNDGTQVLATPDVQEQFDNKFEFLERLAAGGMGVVFKAKQRGLNRLVAIKILQSMHLNPKSVKRFQQEAQALGKLDHKNLVRVFELGVTPYHQPYTVMEFVDGKSLAELIEETGRASLTKTLNVLMQICDGLEFVHALGIFHRDLKPSNIMLVNPYDDNPTVKLVDFGIAKVVDNDQLKSLTQTGEVFGSPLFMSPEQAKGTGADHRSDLYSLGCIMYEMLTGQPPFSGQSSVEVILKQVSEKQRPLNEVVPGSKFPNVLETIVAKLLEKDPKDRYQSAQEVRAELFKLASRERNWYHIAVPGLRTSEAGGPTSMLPFALLGVFLVAIVGFILYFAFESPAEMKVRLWDKCPFSDVTKQIGKNAPNNEMFSKADGMQLQVRQPGPLLNLTGIPLQQLPWLKRRTDNYVTHFRSDKIDDATLPALTGFPLRHLDLSHSRITNASLNDISKIGSLIDVNLSNISLHSTSCRDLARLHQLQTLTLNNCQLDDQCIQALCQNNSYVDLQLAGNPHLTDASTGYLTDAKLHLARIDLSASGITDRSMHALAGLEDLQEIHLRKVAGLTDYGLQPLARMQSLLYLDIFGTGITDQGLINFHPANLLKLDVGVGGKLSDKAIEQFHKQNPHCFINAIPASEEALPALKPF